MAKATAIFQVRLGSKRLPGKVLIDIWGKSLLEHVVERVLDSKHIQEIILATTDKAGDDPIIEFADKHSFKSFRGSEENVLDRFYKAAKLFASQTIVRITPDDPFKDPRIIDQAVELFISNQNEIDYVTNTLPPTYPLGLDVEVFSFETLEKAWKEAVDPYDTEHVTPYIWKRPEVFKIKNISYHRNLSHLRWTLDNDRDLLFARAIYSRLYTKKPVFLFHDILELLEKEPQLSKINS